MKRTLITAFAIVVLLLLIFNVTEVQVFDENLNVAISGAKVNNFLTNEEGIAKFLDFSFSPFLTLERIGYETTKLKTHFSPLYRLLKVGLSEADAQYIKSQVTNWANGISNYRYELTTKRQNYSYKFVQVIDGKNKYTKTETEENGKVSSTEIFVISDKVYTRINGGEVQAVENPEDYIANNLILIPLSDVIDEFLNSVDGSVKFSTPNNIQFLSNNSNNKLTLIISSSGIPSELLLETESNQILEEASLKIDLENTKVSLDEK
jgi:hypothetical protein